MNDMTDNGYYDMALYFPSHVTLGRLHELVDKLSDNDIDIVYTTLDFAESGLYCEAQTGRNDVEKLIKDIGNGDVLLDWDTMSEWV